MTLRVPTGAPINRVKCVVDTCRFNQGGKHCIASGIEIQSPSARNTQETDCATFAPVGGE